MSTYHSQAFGIWRKIQQAKSKGSVLLDGSHLDVGSVIAVAKYNCDAYVNKTDTLVRAMDGSVKMLEEYLSQGHCIYGVNTGFGGSADTRTKDLIRLQSALLQLTQAGILTKAAMNSDEEGSDHSMPVTWVRASMIIRCNSALRGHSGVRLEVIEAILHLLRMGMTPIVPLRGSISASGDLMPLAYIAGVLEGNPDIHVRVRNDRRRDVMPANMALQIAGLQPFVLGPKEGLGLINGTAASAAVGCLAVHECHKLSILAQALVAMSCEALLGKAESYHPFIAAISPHPGQIECAGNILRFLQGSLLAEPLEQTSGATTGLFQDRYALRGAPQWLGPQLEDLSTVLSQIDTELNSTSDNPVIDTSAGGIYSGANFIASSVANGMEKSRLSLQIIGRLLFSLSSELMNPALSRGLPPNLAADDPSLSFTMKGVDISMAAYMSELGYLANPVTSHVQSAEMNNQSINSLALLSGRFTMQAATVLAHMAAAHLFATCQALDLRVLHISYLRALKASIGVVTESLLDNVNTNDRDILQDQLYGAIAASWNASVSMDLDERCEIMSNASLPALYNHLRRHGRFVMDDVISDFMMRLKELAYSLFNTKREEFFKAPTTKMFLGHASKKLYSFVREEIGVPFHQGLVEHPTQGCHATINGRQKKTVGGWISMIYEAIVDDKIWASFVEE